MEKYLVQKHYYGPVLAEQRWHWNFILYRLYTI